jgi:hypothetical protein
MAVNNHWLAKLQKRVKGPKTCRSRKNNLSREQRREIQLKSRTKKFSLEKDLENAQKTLQTLAMDIAVKHGHKESWARERVLQQGKTTGYRRAVNKFNAWVHCKGLEINDGMSPLQLFVARRDDDTC